jgi:hydantoinase/carbamoylase family amidase
MDTVPGGGRFDGALGIACALESLYAAREAREEGADRLGLVCFTDEEGVRFGLGMTGSRAVAGDLTVEEIEAAATVDGTRLAEVLRAAGRDPQRVPQASQRRSRMGAYLEVHPEQGRKLERMDLPAGVVTAIVGIRQVRVEVTGEYNHAGTTLPDDRRDALVPVAAAVLDAQEAMRESEDLVVTIGEADVLGGAVNIIPGRARFSLDVRSSAESAIDTATHRVLGRARRAAEENACALTAEVTKRLAPVPMASRVVEALLSAAAETGIQVVEMPSMAGHDAMTLSASGVRCGMVFVRSAGGISHSPKEESSREDCAAGAELALAAALRLARDLEG